MVVLHSAYHLLLMVMLTIWARAETEDLTCAQKGGTCVPEDDSSCSHEVDYPGCDEDERCCISLPGSLRQNMRADSCGILDCCQEESYKGICRMECPEDRIQTGDCNEECKCCGCKIKNQCRKKDGHCIRKDIDTCDGKTEDSWCNGRMCTCCIPNDRTCGMLNTDPISSDPLNYYAFVIPIPLLDGVTLCPPGSVLVPYEIPSYQSYGPRAEGFTCTDNSWVLKQHSLGFTNCRMDLQYNTEFAYHDAAGWSGIRKPYHEAMRNCYANSCNGVVCNTKFDFCWLKIKTPAEVGVKPVSSSIRQLWTTVCE